MEKVLIWSQSQDSQLDMIARDLDFLIRVALEWVTYYSCPVIEIPTLGVQHSFPNLFPYLLRHVQWARLRVYTHRMLTGCSSLHTNIMWRLNSCYGS